MSQKYFHPVSKHLMADYDRKLAAMSEKDRNFVKEVMAEQYMEKTAGQRGLRMAVTPADKGHRGGPDGSTVDRNGRIGRAEAKAETSPLSKGQRNPVKTLQTDNAKSEQAKGQFGKSSDLDKRAAQQTRTTLERGQGVSYDVSRSRRVAGGFETKVDSRTYMARETGTKGGPVTTTRSAGAIGGGFKPAVQTSFGLGDKKGSGGPGGGL